MPAPDSESAATGFGSQHEPPAVADHTLLRLIGRGSYGEVWLARNIMGTYRAVKVVHRSNFNNDGPYEREFAGIRKFEPISRSHESQVNILHIGRDDAKGHFYYVMELADDAPAHNDETGAARRERNHSPGDDRGSKIEHSDRGQDEEGTTRSNPDQAAAQSGKSPGGAFEPESYVPRTLQYELDKRGRLPFEESLRISLALTDALKHLHRHGLVHRDIKPSNIIFVNGIPKLADIGLVTESDATLTYVGAQGYMAPEGPGRPQGDVYSLGKLIYEMWSGRDRMDFPALPQGFGEWADRKQALELRAVSEKAAEPEAAKRYASAEDLSKDLVMLQAGKSVKRLRWLERNWRWASGAFAVTVVAAAALTLRTITLQQAGRAVRREGLIRTAHEIRSTEHKADWRGSVLEKLQAAAHIRLDDDIRAEAAAAFSGLESEVVRELTNYGAAYVAFDPQGRQLLMDGGSKGQAARLLDVATGRLIQFNVSGRGPVWFGPDGKPRLLRATRPGSYEAVDLRSGSQLLRFELGPAPYHDRPRQPPPMTTSPGGTFAAVAAPLASMNDRPANRCRLGVWSIESGAAIKLTEENCSSLAFSPDGTCLAIGDSQGGVHVRSLPEWDLIIPPFTNDNATVDCLAFGPDAEQTLGPGTKYPWLLAAGDSGGTIWIHTLSPPGIRAICRGSANGVLGVAFSPDGMTLISSGRSPFPCRFWDVATGAPLLNGQGYDFAEALASSPDGRQVALGSHQGFGPSPGAVWVLSEERHRGIGALRGLSAPSTKVVFSRDGKWLAALANNWKVAIWNLSSNRLERVLRVPQGLTADNAALAFSPDSDLFAFATSGEAKLWDRKTGLLKKSWPLPAGLQEILWFDLTNQLFLFQWDYSLTGTGGLCCMRELPLIGDPAVLSQFSFFKGRPFDSSASLDGRVLAVCGSLDPATYTNHVLKIFNPQTGEELFPVTSRNTGDGEGLALDPAGQLLECMNEKGGSDFFEVPSGRPAGHAAHLAAAISPGGIWLVSDAAPEDAIQGLRLYRRDAPGRRVLLGAGLRSNQPTFSPDGRLLAWGTSDGTVMVCEMERVISHLTELRLGWR